MPENLKTPGVYILEKNNSANSVVQVSTAVPVFIGYTEKNSINGKSFLMKPEKITSMSEYEALFGGPSKPVFTLQEANDGVVDVNIGGVNYTLKQSDNSTFYLYNSLKLFYANGGADCYVISIGTYGDKVEVDSFKKAIDLLEGEEVPTMLLMPDSLLLSEDDGSYYSVQTYALRQCAEHKDKIALFDIYGANAEQPLGSDKNLYINRFRENIGLENLSYGACYYPWVKTNVITKNDINYSFFDLDSLSKIVGENSKVSEVLGRLIAVKDKSSKDYYDRALTSVWSVYQLLKMIVTEKLCVMPVAPLLAGVYTRTDRSSGVWIAPANQNLDSVIAPAIKVTSKEQEDLNVDAVSGKSINVIRAFKGRGSAMVWGARTLDGNNNEWRYVNVRRLFIMIEQSIKSTAFSMVFKANTEITWSVVKASLNNFLTNLWRQGALVGASPSEAFCVLCGLGETMDENDVNNGIMRIQVKAAPSRPAEFIVISFEQKMGEK